MIPPEVAAAWGWLPTAITALAGGLINATFVVHDAERPIAVVQRLHPVFGAEVNLDLEAVTAHLAARGLETPRLLRTLAGEPWLVHEGVWRALTWVDGDSVDAVPDPAWARAAGEQVGRFHVALGDFEYDYRFVRAGVHETAAHLAKLHARIAAGAPEPREARELYAAQELREAVELGEEIAAAAAELPALPTLPRRHVHGDLKISNVRFRRDPLRAVALLDLDTLGKGVIAFELGDALRSWCNPRGEDEAAARFELPIFAAAIAGFRSVADPIVTPVELASIAIGLETVCIELAARFAVDAFDDAYFGWNPAKFPSRRAHNLVRARGQLALGLAVRAAKSEVVELLSTSRTA